MFSARIGAFGLEGLEVIWLKDAFEYQELLLGERLTLPLVARLKVISEIDRYLMLQRTSPVDVIEEYARGKEVVLNNPHVLSYSPLNIPRPERRAILDRAIANCNRKISMGSGES